MGFQYVSWVFFLVFHYVAWCLISWYMMTGTFSTTHGLRLSVRGDLSFDDGSLDLNQ